MTFSIVCLVIIDLNATTANKTMKANETAGKEEEESEDDVEDLMRKGNKDDRGK